MFEKYKNYIKYMKTLQAEQKTTFQNPKYLDESYEIEVKLELNIENLKKILGKSDDFVLKRVTIGDINNTEAFLCFIDGLGDKQNINENIIKPLQSGMNTKYNDQTLLSLDTFGLVKNKLLSESELKILNSLDEVVNCILSGWTAIFIEGYDISMVCCSKCLNGRSITEPDTETVIRGSHEGFVETIRINTVLIRKIIKNPNLVFESLVLGKQTHTDVTIAYIDGIANEKIVEEVRNRLYRIETDAILESGYLEAYIDDNPFSPFSTIGNSERPDKVAAKILEGRVAILCSGTPYILTVPYLFIEAFQAAEDYYSRPFLTSLVRMVRLFSFFVTLTFPALFVAIGTFHQEMIPTVLLITMAAAREGTPFPAVIETILIIGAFEILRESGVRLPRQVGQAVSIVGALVIGEASVQAGLISAPTVIIGALTGITSFVVVPVLDAVLIFRLFLLLLGASIGLYGVVAGTIIMIAHMCTLRSFGTPYLSPISPVSLRELGDSAIRLPIWLLKYRPKSIVGRDSKRQAHAIMPNKPDKKGSR